MKLPVAIACFLACYSLALGEPGALVIVGGGGTPDDVLRETIRLAGGESAKVVILPQASSREDRGVSSKEMFRRFGVSDVDIAELDDPQSARTAIETADLIWFPGGQQSRLMEALAAADVVDTIAKSHSTGVVIGGTSAGAAVMSADMIVHMPESPALRAANTPVAKGLGLSPDLIVDQHFVERNRMNRLLGAVLDRPKRIGVGIAEQTAIIVKDHSFSVMGKGSVVVIDGRNADVLSPAQSRLQRGKKLQLHVLSAGDEFQF